MGNFIRKSRWIGLALLALVVLPPPSRAEVPGALARLVRGPTVRLALDTSQGRALFRALGLARGDSEALLRVIARPGAEPLRTSLEESLTRIEADTAELRAAREAAGRPLTPGEEGIFVRLMSRRLLELENPSRFSSLFGPRGIVFVDEAAIAGTRARPERVFRAWEAPGRVGLGLPSERLAEAGGSATASREVAAESTPGVGRRFLSRLRNFMDEMRLCQLRQPPSAIRSSRINYFLTSLAVNEAIIAGSYVVGMGEESFSLEELSTDLLIGAIYTAAGVSFLRPNQRFLVQWIKVSSAILVQDGMDSVIYFISPLHRIRTGGESRHTVPEAVHRFEYNASYTLLSSGWREVVMYELINGLMCLYPGSRLAKIGTTALRITDATIGTIIYFRLRREVMGH